MTKNIFITALAFFAITANAQSPSDKLWHLQPYSKTGNSGIGLEEAKELVKGKTPETVIVAIADAGVDIEHPDLKTMLWTNKDEIPDNGIDDDNNGYIDDVYGWNFCGETTFDNMELTREYARLNAKYELQTETAAANVAEYNRYLELKEKYLKEHEEAKQTFGILELIMGGMEALEENHGEEMTIEEVQNHTPRNKKEQIAKNILLANAKRSKDPFDFKALKDEMQEGYDHYDFMYNYAYNANFDPREKKVGDDYANATETGYGNNKVYYGERFSNHGTHVAGIVAADASNDFGAEGICQSCEIMSIRNVPEGDERDKDVANAIRYAADNGAKIVNMSFGKGYAYRPEVVQDAIRYAESKGVLLIHAAGNSGQNNDESDNFPNDNNDAYNNWIEVGASNWEEKPAALAVFSNYGKQEVDLFAPGVAIYSTTPEGQYEAFDGTSMASPVVAGVAAFVWSYYPTLTAAQLKEILVNSAIPIKGRNRIPGSRRKKGVKKLSKTGGEVNLPAALILAELMLNK